MLDIEKEDRTKPRIEIKRREQLEIAISIGFSICLKEVGLSPPTKARFNFSLDPSSPRTIDQPGAL